ncbi:MAG: SRPBCC family protein, partial [Nocardioides sp.]|nr:SRPBCC family protein [Nocardioides sp.]
MTSSSPLTNLRRGLRQGAALASVAGQAVRSPELRRSLLDQVTGRGGAGEASTTVAGALPAPDGVADFPRHVHAQQDCAAAPADVVARLHDVAGMADWLTIHSNWRGDAPTAMTPGESFAQQILLMDIPAEARWTVARADETGFALRGTGPMGITLGLWATVAAHGTGSTVRLDAALDGAPVRGPIGSTAVRSLERALHESLTDLTSSLTGSSSPRLRLSSAPVLHVASGRELDPATPVVV